MQCLLLKNYCKRVFGWRERIDSRKRVLKGVGGALYDALNTTSIFSVFALLTQACSSACVENLEISNPIFINRVDTRFALKIESL